MFKKFLSIFKKNNNNFIFKNNETCPICIDIMTEKEWKNKEIIILYPCNHQIHLNCFFTWICYSKCKYHECLYCRQYINYIIYFNCKDSKDIKYILTIISKNLQMKCNKIKINIFDNNITINTNEKNFPINLLNMIKNIYVQNNLSFENKSIVSVICQIMTSEIILNKKINFNNENGYFIYT